MGKYKPFTGWCEKFVQLRNPTNGEIEPVKWSGPIITNPTTHVTGPWQKIILDEAFYHDSEGKFRYETIVYSTVKKSGKTAINAMLMAYWAFNIESPNEIITVANKRDQAVARGYREMQNFIKRDSVLQNRIVSSTGTKMELDNGTTILAIPNDFSGEAGSNHGLTTWDELWGFTTERDLRLWDELTPVPTRHNSLRFISTYAGFTGESLLLETLYYKVFDEQHLPRTGSMFERPLGEDVPVYTIPDQKLFVYWDNEGRLPWQTKDYYAGQMASLRTNAFDRLHKNLWVSSESGLFDMTQWDECIDENHRPPLPNKEVTLYVGIDIGIKRDRCAVVSVYRDGDKLKLGPKKFWQPSKEEPIDLEETVEAYVLELSKGFQIAVARYDPYQFHRSATTLVKEGLNMQEYPQTVSNLQVMGQNIYDLVKYGQIVLYKDKDLRFEANCARAKEAMRGLQITKEKSTQKIDQIVALAMAAVDVSFGFFDGCDLTGVPGHVNDECTKD